ncbi:cell envelope integrity protein TolA [Tahibacter caeni]|uniref:cell envelope integrity protein TolA n=1 Tax=Tahibacter caeni TaxID=1453545 RepID=UPI002147DCB7|nr:cell envelope integrity protein TolA [Tahibacter caeni]
MARDEDNLRPFLYSLAVHLAVLALVSASLWWTSNAVSVAVKGQIIEATLVGPSQAPKPVSKPKPKPKPVETKPVETPKAEEPAPEPPKKDTKDQEKITEKVTQLKADENARAQEELKKKQQQELAEKQAAAEAEKQKKLKEEREKQQREKQAREQAKKEQEYLDAMIAEEAKTGQEGLDTSLEAEYYAAIQKAVSDAWLRPDTTPPGLRCTLEITQILGGDVIQAVVVSPCNADTATRTTLEQAPRRASPLPYRGYETVFKRKIRFEFTYDG